ncbi:MAG: hypothetical protein JRC89_12750, partial [Deltaproteobacteria bacterium]|nr:hypothetical protein [Deltaproteobacteria bacterium]
SRGYEVDFLIKDKGQWALIQVCHDLAHIDTFSRERKALISGLKELKINTGTIINDSEKRVEQCGNYKVEHRADLGMVVEPLTPYRSISLVS